MAFEQHAQEELYARLAGHLRDGFGELAEAVDDVPAFVVELGPTRMLVSADANGPEKASVMLYASVGHGIVVTPSVALYLVRKAHELPLVTVSVREDDRIMLRQVLLGEAVTHENVVMMIRMFADVCAEVDDELTMQFR